METYEITTDASRLDVDAIHDFLSKTYWSPGVPKSKVARAIANSICFGVFLGSKQVGFARVITDRATFAYLADVYILEEHRGKGLAHEVIQKIMQHSDLQGLRRMLLATRDAHSLYARHGFKRLAAPDRMMELHNPSVYIT